MGDTGWCSPELKDRNMGYGIRHLDGSGEDDPPISTFEALYSELQRADGEHNDVAVIDDDTGWCITAYPSGLVIFQSLADGSAYHMRNMDRVTTIRLWTLLARGAIEDIRKLPWEAGFK